MPASTGYGEPIQRLFKFRDGERVVNAAQGDMFRTTPLWGIGQRLFFLHDGRTSDLLAGVRRILAGTTGSSSCLG